MSFLCCPPLSSRKQSSDSTPAPPPTTAPQDNNPAESSAVETEAMASKHEDSERPSSLRLEVEETLKTVKQLISKSASPIPTYAYEPKNDPDKNKMTTLLQDLHKMGFKDVETLLSLLNSEVKGVQDDNKFLLEHLVQLLAKLGDDSKIGNQLTGSFINTLWGGIAHPPQTVLGKKYMYRTADGSNNNIYNPSLGAAQTPYARSAKPVILQNVALPDPGLIFDSLMARGDTFEPHPNKVSSQLFYLATIIIHDIFRTDHADFNISDTSSYLDLAPLYGSNQQEQDLVRSFEDGKLKPDCFSEKRILGFPPGVSIFLIMFNRFHNYVVTTLAAINENGRFNKPKEGAAKSAWTQYDEDLFQTGRLITCGLYVNCVLKDYVRTILNLVRTGTKWDLDPRTEEGKTLFNTPAAEGVGNSVSAEFNLIYRWHSAISVRDEIWTQQEWARLFPDVKDPADVTLKQLLAKLVESEAAIPDDPLLRPIAGGIPRGKDNKFSDDDLVKILQSGIEDVSGSFGANRVPRILRSVEILGIIQARYWNLASLNEFRQFAGLTPHATFEDINPDPEVAQKLKDLYDHPDYVELYPGLVAEKAKPKMDPGSGLCVNFTTSYSILSDAVGLVRGDRHYTTDYTPKYLTNWGYNEVQYDVNVDDGAVLYKLILNAFPNHFKDNSVYAHFPFIIPSENKVILDKLGRSDKYSWDKPERKPPTFTIKSYAAVKKILEDKTIWQVTSGEAINTISNQDKGATYGTSHCLAGDESANESSKKILTKSLHPKDWNAQVKKFFEEATISLLKTYSFKVPGKKNTHQIDIVRDVANLANARFAASVFSLPLKTEETPRGIYTEQELYQVLALLYVSIFSNLKVEKGFQITEAAKLLAKQLGELILINTEAIAATGVLADIIAKLHQHSALTEYGTFLIQTLLENKLPIKDIVWGQILPTAATMTANQAAVFSQAFDYYLGDGAKYKEELYTLAHANTKEADEKLLRYFLEGARLSTTLPITRRYEPPANTYINVADGTHLNSIPPHSLIILDIAAASVDPAAFPDPLTVNLTRPLDSYIMYGYGPHACIGKDVSWAAMTAMFKVVFGLKNVQRVKVTYYPGVTDPGILQKVGDKYLTEDWSSFLPFPASMKITWEE